MNQLKTGQFISFLRKEKKMTQSELGELLGVSGKAVSKWERGKSFPDITLLKPLSECLGTTVNELLEGSIVKDDRQQNSDEKLIQTLLYNYHLRRKIYGLILVISVFILYFIARAYLPDSLSYFLEILVLSSILILNYRERQFLLMIPCAILIVFSFLACLRMFLS